MATANETIRDAFIRHQIGMIRASGSLSRDIIKLLEESEAELRKAIDERLAGIVERGAEMGPTTTQRLLEMEAQLRAILEIPHREINETISGFLGDLAEREPTFIKNVLEDALPVIVNLGVPPAAVLRELITYTPLDGKVLNDWLIKFEADHLENIMDEVRRGITQGETNRQIARRIFGTQAADGADGARIRTMRGAQTLARTLTNGVGNHARQAFYAENAALIQAEVYTATLDNRTTVICGSLDGKAFDVGKGPIPPLHPNCRSLRVPSINGRLIGERPAKSATKAELDGLSQAARRNRVNELTGRVPASQTYSQFLKRQRVAFQNEVLGVERARLFREGKLTLDKFVDERGRLFSLDELMRREPDAFRTNRAWKMAS